VALSAFDDASTPPSAEALTAVLGAAAPWWIGLVDDVRANAGGLVERWVYGGPKFGWSLRLVRGERILVYLTPQAGALLAGVVLGDKAIATATAALGVSERTLAIVSAAPKDAEGRGVRLSVEGPEDLEIARQLVRIKLAR
jgi:hypothetical protein